MPMFGFKPGSEYDIVLPLDDAERLTATIRHNERFVLVVGFVLGLMSGVAGTLAVIL